MSNIEVLKSKRFISSLVGMILMLVVSAWPELQPYQEQLTNAIATVIVALIAGYSLEDFAIAIKTNLPKIIQAAEDVASEVEKATKSK